MVSAYACMDEVFSKSLIWYVCFFNTDHVKMAALPCLFPVFMVHGIGIIILYSVAYFGAVAGNISARSPTEIVSRRPPLATTEITAIYTRSTFAARHG